MLDISMPTKLECTRLSKSCLAGCTVHQTPAPFTPPTILQLDGVTRGHPAQLSAPWVHPSLLLLGHVLATKLLVTCMHGDAREVPAIGSWKTKKVSGH